MAIGPFCAKFGLVFPLVLSSSLALATPPTEAIQHFLQDAHGVVAELQLDNPNAESIVTVITEMLEDAKLVVAAFGEKHTQCAAQLARIIELYPEIDVWPAQQIRRDIEGGRALPAAEGCYPARDVVAHPAIVRAFARIGISSSQRVRLVNEMNEAIEHMEEILADLAQE